MPHLILCAIAASSLAQEVHPITEDSLSLRNIVMAVHLHNQQHGAFPATLADTFPDVQDLTTYVSTLSRLPDDQPDDPQAWIAANASFDYLPNADVDMNDIPDWHDVVIAHLDLTTGHAGEPTPDNPSGTYFPVAFLDGHIETLPLPEAKRRVAESTQLFDGLASGGPLPERFQVIIDMRAVNQALHAYADDHDGILPPTLGPTLDYVATTKRTPTPRAKASVFLSPKRARTTFIPEEPSPEWIDRHTSLKYLGADHLFLAWIEDPSRLILLHANDPVAGADVVAIATVDGRVSLEPEAYADAIAEESARVIAALTNTTRLPDVQHAMRDLRLISEAASRYAAEHDGRLPETLGPLLDHIPDDLLTDAYAPMTARQRALVFISPADESGIVPPDDPTPDWVDAKASYAWLAGGLDLQSLQNEGVMCIAHAPLDQPLDGASRHPSEGYIPFVTSTGQVIASPADATRMTADDALAIIDRLLNN